MFLDEKLLMICEQSLDSIKSGDDIQALNIRVLRECEAYYKSKLTEKKMTEKEVKAVIDRTFNLFDSFVRNAKKSENKALAVLGNMFEEYSFKNQFLSNEKIRNVYESL